jgi:hypothetical protein
MLIDNPPTTTLGRDLAFDAAGNLYVASSGQASVRVYSPGYASRAVTGSDGTFNVARIINDPPLVTLTSSDTNMFERITADQATFTVTRLGSVTAPLNVVVTYGGTATPGVDYDTPPTVVTIPAGRISASASLSPINNAVLDGNRTVVVSVAEDAAYTFGTNTSAILTVRDDEIPAFPVLLSDDFDADHSANYTVVFGAENGVDDKIVDFNFDYSTIGIPSAPHSEGSTTRGLKLQVNKNDATGSAAGVNVYANGVTFSNEFALRFDMFLSWSNANGSTEHAIFGINHAGTFTNRALSAGAVVGGDGAWAAIESDGSASSSGRSYAIFGSTNSSTAAPFSSASARSFDAYFTSPPYMGVPGGSPSGQWADVELSQTNRAGIYFWTLKVNNVIILSRTNNGASATSGTIMLGHMDSFASVGNVNNFTVIDNVRVVNLTAYATTITSIRRIGAIMEILFTSDPTDEAEAFTVLSSTSVTGGFAPDNEATVTPLGGGLFRVTSPNSTDLQRFYRIQK